MKYWAILIIAICFGACQDIKQPEKPKNLVGKEKMVNILTEAYLANAARSVDNRSIVEEGIEMDSLFYKKFEVDSLVFARSHAFYAADVDTYTILIQQVKDRLDKMEKNLDSIRNAQNQTKNTVPKSSGKKPI